MMEKRLLVTTWTYLWHYLLPRLLLHLQLLQLQVVPAIAVRVPQLHQLQLVVLRALAYLVVHYLPQLHQPLPQLNSSALLVKQSCWRVALLLTLLILIQQPLLIQQLIQVIQLLQMVAVIPLVHQRVQILQKLVIQQATAPHPLPKVAVPLLEGQSNRSLLTYPSPFLITTRTQV